MFYVKIPLVFKFTHSSKERVSSSSLIVKIETDDGYCGYGEGTPRDYVTGESIASSIAFFQDSIIPYLIYYEIENLDSISSILKKIDEITNEQSNPSILCAIELALLDILGKRNNKPISGILFCNRSRAVNYSAVLPILPVDMFTKYLHMVKVKKIRYLKLKVGTDSDIDRLKSAREILGNDINIRVDANEAWDIDEAIDKILAFERYHVSAVEQPIKKSDHNGLEMILRKVSVPLILDESLCNMSDAKLLRENICTDNLIFNIRLSKCGGIFKSLKILDYANKHGVKSMLGCHVGETGILSAAGRHFAQSIDGLLFVEGSYSNLILEEDIINQDLLFGDYGVGVPLVGPGLGVEVLGEKILKYAKGEITS